MSAGGDHNGARPAYAFGDTATASQRLAVLATVFGPTSVALLDDLSVPERATVLDLGCGPGHTTAMLADVFPGATVIGVDASEAFVAEATASLGRGDGSDRHDTVGRRRFAVADVMTVPLPGAPADVIYARFLVVHLPDPVRALALWAGQLRPGGMLVAEEPERIDTDDGDFRRYLELASAVVAARGGDLYAGRLLADVAAPPSTDVVVRRRTALSVTTGRAATIFSLNLSLWRHDPAVAAVAGAQETADLADRLERRRGDTGTGVIGWWMRQLVVARGRGS